MPGGPGRRAARWYYRSRVGPGAARASGTGREEGGLTRAGRGFKKAPRVALKSPRLSTIPVVEISPNAEGEYEAAELAADITGVGGAE